MSLTITSITSPLGPITLVSSPVGLKEVHFANLDSVAQRLSASLPFVIIEPDKSQAAVQLQEYFRGERRGFDLQLDLQGTPFQQKVWKALMAIPYGETRSYRDIAREINCPKGFRAVGQANGSNPIPIIIPCHRVVASDGSLGGYSGGLEIKKALLALEGVL